MKRVGRRFGVYACLCLTGALAGAACDGPRETSAPTGPSTIAALETGTTPAPTASPAPSPAPAPAGYTTFDATGLVTDTDDRPIAGAVVTRAGADRSDGPATSGPNGEFAIRFRVPDYYAAGHIAALFYAVASGYEGPAGQAEILNFAMVNPQIRIRMRRALDAATGVRFEDTLRPNDPDWGWRDSMMCPCLRVHVHPVLGQQMRIRLTSSGRTPLRVGAEAQNLPNADYYEQHSAFFKSVGSLTPEGDRMISEVVIPEGFIYNGVVTIGRDGKAGVTEPASFEMVVE